MAVFKLDVEKKFGQFQHRFYAQGTQAAAPTVSRDINGLLSEIKTQLASLTLSPEQDQVVFRGIAYDSTVALTETVRLSRY